MIANMNANNGKRLLAAVAIFAMLACVFAVAVPADAAASEDAVTFDGENSFTDAGSPASSGEKTVSNAGLGNTIEYTYDDETKTYTLTGVLNKQDIAWDATNSKFVGTNLTDSAKGGYGQHWDYAKTAQYYWLFLELNASGTITNADNEASTSDTDFILYLTEETKDIVRTITIGSDEYLFPRESMPPSTAPPSQSMVPSHPLRTARPARAPVPSRMFSTSKTRPRDTTSSSSTSPMLLEWTSFRRTPL